MTTEKMRVTYHTAKAAVSPKHNDRKFDTRNSDHIDPVRSDKNIYWQWNQDQVTGERPGTFEEAEEEFYDENFTAGQEAKNQRYIKNRHKERIKTVDEMRKTKNGMPVESILQIGNRDNTVPPELLWDITCKQLEWERTSFPNIVTLTVALHVDEEGAPHVHKRDVYIAHDEDGNLIVNQEKALYEMGIERDDLDNPSSRYNNAKIVYTRMCRDHLIELCEEHGLSIEKEPKAPSKSGKTLLEYQIAEMKTEKKELEAECTALHEEKENQKKSLEDIMTAQIEASKIKRRFGDKETVTYHKSCVDKAQDIAKQAREYRDHGDRLFKWAVAEKREAAKLRDEAEEGIQLIKEYSIKKKKLDKYISQEAKEIADKRVNDALENIKNNEYTRAIIAFMRQFASLDGQGTLYDDFDRAYTEMLFNKPDRIVDKEVVKSPDNDIELPDDEIEH